MSAKTRPNSLNAFVCGVLCSIWTPCREPLPRPVRATGPAAPCGTASPISGKNHTMQYDMCRIRGMKCRAVHLSWRTGGTAVPR